MSELNQKKVLEKDLEKTNSDSQSQSNLENNNTEINFQENKSDNSGNDNNNLFLLEMVKKEFFDTFFKVFSEQSVEAIAAIPVKKSPIIASIARN